MSVKVPCNANGEPADARDLQIARAAGGLTHDELHKKMRTGKLKGRTFWHDEHTDLHIPDGVLLFRPWRKPAEPTNSEPARDHMELEQ